MYSTLSMVHHNTYPVSGYYVRYIVVQYLGVGSKYSTVQYSTVQYSTVQYNTVQYTVQYLGGVLNQFHASCSPTSPLFLRLVRNLSRVCVGSDYTTVLYLLYCTIVLFCTQLSCTVHYSPVLYTITIFLYCTQLSCTVHYCPVLYTIVLHCTQLSCTVHLYCTVHYCPVLYTIVLYCTLLYCTVHCCTELLCTILFYMYCRKCTVITSEHVNTGLSEIIYFCNRRQLSISEIYIFVKLEGQKVQGPTASVKGAASLVAECGTNILFKKCRKSLFKTPFWGTSKNQ